LNRWLVGDRIPAVLTREELAEGLGWTLRQVDNARRRAHPAIRPKSGPGRLFDGVAVQQWINEHTPAEVGRRFFGAARRTG